MLKKTKTNPDIILEVITILSILFIEYNNDIEKLVKKLDILSKQYPYYLNKINGYFKETKLKYFKDHSFSYNKFPKDIRTNLTPFFSNFNILSLLSMDASMDTLPLHFDFCYHYYFY